MNAESAPCNVDERRLPKWVAPAMFALAAAGFVWTFRWMATRWEQENSYYSHGWLVLPISAFLVYRCREGLARCHKGCDLWGFAVLIPALTLHLVATAWRIGFLSGFAMLGVLVGLILLLYGRLLLRAILFPVVFLVFMVPLPEVLIEKISFTLKMMAAAVAAAFLDLVGLVAVREGSYIHTPNGPVVVDDVCSGLKYLIALTAFGALYSYVSALKGRDKYLLFAAAIPISFLANVVRVTLLVLIGYNWGVEATQKWYSHDLLGFALFGVAFVMLFTVESVLLRLRNRDGSDEGSQTSENEVEPGLTMSPTGMPPLSRRRAVGLAAVLLVGALGMSTFLSRPRPATSTSTKLSAIPLELAGGEWSGSDYTMSDRVYEILGTRDVLSRRYVGSEGEVNLVVVLAEQIRRRTHPPEQCVTGDGSIIRSTDQLTVELDGSPLRSLRVNQLVLEGRNGQTLMWYFYKSGDRLTTSYWRHQAGIALRALTDPNAADALVRLDAPVTANDFDAAEDRLRGFLDDVMPSVMDILP